MADIQSATAENRPGKQERRRRRRKIEETTGRKYNGLPYLFVFICIICISCE